MEKMFEKVLREAKSKTFTFKNGEKYKGLARVGSGTPSIAIKYDGKLAGHIMFNDSWTVKDEDHGKISIQLFYGKDEEEMLKNPNCDWKNVTLKKRFSSADEAKEFLKLHAESLLPKIKLQDIYG